MYIYIYLNVSIPRDIWRGWGPLAARGVRVHYGIMQVKSEQAHLVTSVATGSRYQEFCCFLMSILAVIGEQRLNQDASSNRSAPFEKQSHITTICTLSGQVLILEWFELGLVFALKF